MGEQAKIQFPEFLSRLKTDDQMVRSGKSAFMIAMPDYDRGPNMGLPVRISRLPDWKVPGAKLLVQFHGAVDQTVRPIPVFSNLVAPTAISSNVLSLTIADESLFRSTEMRAAWYQGSSVFDVSGAVSRFIDELVANFQFERVVFLGSSVGAHAALTQSLRIPESLCIANNPIASIVRYGGRHAAAFLGHCWPGVASLEELSGKVVLDVADLYRRGHENHIIVVQNPTDGHGGRQAIPFLSQLPWKGRSALISEYQPGFEGHKFDPARLQNWGLAALEAEEKTCFGIMSQFHRLNGPEAAQKPVDASHSSKSSDAATRGRAPSDTELNLASKLAAYLMSPKRR